MIACKQCESMNSLDGAFCKKCGLALPEEELALARQKLDELVKEGFHIFHEGRVEEAAMVAESVLVSDPGCVQALSLKGLCHERQGRIAEALEAFEHSAELNPDSTLDRIKVNQLRNKLATPAKPEPMPANRRLAVMGAMATVVLVVAIGALIGVKASAQDAKPETKASGTPDPGANAVALQPIEQVQPQQNTGQTDPNPPQVDTNRTQPVLNDPVQSGVTRIPPYDGGTLPGTGDDGNKPVTFEFRNAPSPGVSSTNEGPKNTGGIDPKFEDPPKEEPKEAPGIIDIKVAGGPKPAGGSDSVDDANRAQALMKTADTKFMLAKYGEAVSSYSAALQAGAPAGRANQRIGDCYKHLGQRDSAISAYTKAATAYEASGNGRAASVCRQAIRDLGG